LNLRTVDLNLLPIFEAIYAERSLTRAGETLHLTQPAVSNALVRLRAALDDPLFVREARSMVPTPAAEALIGPVREALTRLRSGLGARARFEPGSSQRVFNVAMGDVAAATIAPVIARRLAATPGVRFNIVQIERSKVAHELGTGGVDFAVDIPVVARADLESASMGKSARYVCALRRDHPAARGKLTLPRFLALQHVLVSSRRSGRTALDHALAAVGERVRAAMRMAHYHAAFEVVKAGDMALTAPHSIAQQFDVALRPLPFAVPSHGFHLFWRRDARHDPAHVWGRQALLEAARDCEDYDG
jgi:DNA-binding transcriptional LysR family regulator